MNTFKIEVGIDRVVAIYAINAKLAELLEKWEKGNILDNNTLTTEENNLAEHFIESPSSADSANKISEQAKQAATFNWILKQWLVTFFALSYLRNRVIESLLNRG